MIKFKKNIVFLNFFYLEHTLEVTNLVHQTDSTYYVKAVNILK